MRRNLESILRFAVPNLPEVLHAANGVEGLATLVQSLPTHLFPKHDGHNTALQLAGDACPDYKGDRRALDNRVGSVDGDRDCVAAHGCSAGCG